MLDPTDLYTISGTPPAHAPDAPLILVHALSGYVDAGDAVRLTARHLLDTLDHREIARFDIDQLFDYRARRPPMLFDEDHWAAYDAPELVVHAVTDGGGREFLLLTGPEPDTQWERFVAAVCTLLERYGVDVTVGLNAIPLATPHTRPIGVTRHATSRDLIPGNRPWLQQVHVPASAAHLLEFRLGEQGRKAMGIAVHVPHYVAQSEFPPAALRLIDELRERTGLDLPREPIATAAAATLAEIDRQVGESTDAMAMVSTLEQQYDAFLHARSGESPLGGGTDNLPSADELAAELERFLAEQARRHRDDRDQ